MLEEMKEFEIEEGTENNVEAIDPLDDLVNHDFSSDETFNLDDSYEVLTMIERENKLAKSLEAENIIKELAPQYIDEEFLNKLNKSFDNVKSFIKKYNVELDDVKNLSETEKDKLFAIGSFLNKNAGYTLNDLMFGITLTREEYKFIYTAVERKLSYDGTEVFNMISLNENVLQEWHKVDDSLPKNIPTMLVKTDINNVVMLYHFLVKHSVKGLDKEFYTFASVLNKIADTNKLFNAYNVMKERLNTDFALWTSALETETEGTVIEPTK